jgi:hypothetical protein
MPKTLLDIIGQAVKDNHVPQAAVEVALREVQGHALFRAWVDDLVRTAVSELVWRERGRINVALKNQAKAYGGPARVQVGASSEINAAYSSYYDYTIGRTVLGSLLGRDLLRVAENERANAAGHVFNAELCEALKPLVPDDRAVRAAVSERRLRNLFVRLKQRDADPAA